MHGQQGESQYLENPFGKIILVYMQSYKYYNNRCSQVVFRNIYIFIYGYKYIEKITSEKSISKKNRQ